MSYESVSVIIPACNADRFVAEAIYSALTQTVAPVEVIVVNDGSKDRTADVLRTFGHQITAISQPGRGAAAARNAGSAVATGRWLAFLDADDTWLPNKLERQLNVARDQQVMMVYTDRFNVGKRGDLPEVQSRLHRLYAGDVFVDLLLLGNRITLSSVLLRADVFRALGGFAEHLKNAEDWDLWVRVAEANRVAACAEPLVCYRFHEGMKSGDPQRMQKARSEIVGRALQTPRGRTLPLATRKRIVAATARTNAWDASRRGAGTLACREYLRALAAWPFDYGVYHDMLRFILGRHR